MRDAASKRERQEAGLAELADMGLSLARDLHARALAATDDKAAADLALAFQRMGRCVRQTYALEQRLDREQRLAERETAARAASDRLDLVQRKRRLVRNAVASLIWTEYEGEEAEDLDDALGALVMDLSEDQAAFLETPLDVCIDAIRADLGLPASDAEPSAPEPPEIRESSG